METLVCVTIGVLCSLSCGAADISLFGKTFLECCDYLTSNILLPFGSFFTCILIGWVVPKRIVRDEFTNWGTVRGRLYSVWLFTIRFVSPVCILAVFLHQLGIL